HIQANFSYSLSYAVGTGSVSNTNGTRASQGAQTPKQTAPLDFDQRHKISINVDYLLAKDEGPLLWNARPFQNTSVNVLYNVTSGTPYTPTEISDEVSLAAVGLKPAG